MQQRVTDFDSDKAWTEQARRLIERDLYPALAWEGRFVYLARSAGSEYLQRVAHIDVVVQTGPGVSITVEEKIVRRKYAALAVETHSRVESGERDGWIYTSTADTLIYAFGVQGGLECWIMSLPALRQWFEPREHDFAERQVMNGRDGKVWYHTRCRLVPLRDIPIQRTLRQLWWNEYPGRQL
jgi:hypothetical protein